MITDKQIEILCTIMQYKFYENTGFLDIFLFELNNIFKHNIKTDDDIIQRESTRGWCQALNKACKKTNNITLFEYYSKLEWYDSDYFDSVLGDVLVRYKNSKIK